MYVYIYMYVCKGYKKNQEGRQTIRMQRSLIKKLNNEKIKKD